jgi:magnesium transporter
VNVTGLANAEALQEVADLFGLHPLALEDVANTHQRAKVEPYEEEVFVVARMATERPPDTEQLSLFFGRGFVLTFQERAGDCFDGVRDRIRRSNRRIRQRGADYLAYALLDSIVDSYFPVLDRMGDELESLEDEVLASPDQDTMTRIYRAKRTLIGLRKAIGPHREALNALIREPTELIADETQLFLRDCYDHAIRIIDVVEAYRELSADLINTYLSAVSNRMNEIMKVLTIIASIFIPLSFIAGLYGMNFDPGASPWNMPELGWRYGYPFALFVMGAVAAVFLIFMWRKGWFR